jgi:hypothetical protein
MQFQYLSEMKAEFLQRVRRIPEIYTPTGVTLIYANRIQKRLALTRQGEPIVCGLEAIGDPDT